MEPSFFLQTTHQHLWDLHCSQQGADVWAGAGLRGQPPGLQAHRDAPKNKLIKVKCATAMQGLVDHTWEQQNQWQPLCRQRPAGLGDRRKGAGDLGRASALAAATWVIRCVRKTDKQRAVRVDGTGDKHPAPAPGPCQRPCPPSGSCGCMRPRRPSPSWGWLARKRREGSSRESGGREKQEGIQGRAGGSGGHHPH